MVEKTIESFDGTRVTYQSFGQGPALVFANGLGVNHFGLRLQIQHFCDKYRILTWNYRGMDRSRDMPLNPDFSAPIHAKDMLSILEAEKIESAHFIGWSLGVQVLFESIRLKKSIFKAMVVISGTYGSPLSSVLSLPGGEWFVPLLFRFANLGPQFIDRLLQLGPEVPYLFELMQTIGVLGAECKKGVFMDMFRSVAAVDKRVYLETLLSIGLHKAQDILPAIRFPILIIVGDRDFLTPVSTAERMHQAIPQSELALIPGGTHYCLIEYPERINGCIERFLQNA
jgi:pimeloyl-ACP methyl ester carboxylesterase